MKYLPLIFLLCLAASGPPMPPVPHVTTVLRSPKDAGNQPKVLLAPAVVAPVVRVITLTWVYPPDQIAAVQFEVWAAPMVVSGPPLATYTNIPTGFQLLIVVDSPPATIQTTLPSQFFIVRARSRTTGAYSPWNQASSTSPVKLTSPVDGQTVSNTIILASIVTGPIGPWCPGALSITQ